MAKQVKSLTIKLADGNEIDWYSLTRDQRRFLKKKLPWLKDAIRQAEAPQPEVEST